MVAGYNQCYNIYIHYNGYDAVGLRGLIVGNYTAVGNGVDSGVFVNLGSTNVGELSQGCDIWRWGRGQY